MADYKKKYLEMKNKLNIVSGKYGLIKDKYTKLLMERGYINKTKLGYESPSTFFKRREWLSLRYIVLKEQGRKCSLCGASGKDYTYHVDHIKPRSLNPELQLEISNLQVLCSDCNLGKGNLHDDDWR